MQKILFVAALAFVITFHSNAQNKKDQPPPPPPQLPMDNTNKITYEEVVDVPGKSAEELYKKVTSWFQTYYKNPGEVIRENDSLKRSITGKPRFRIYNPPDKEGTRTDGGL